MNVSLLKGMRTSEMLLLAAGISMLLAVPWIDQSGWWLWIFSKAAYFTGIGFFILNR